MQCRASASWSSALSPCARSYVFMYFRQHVGEWWWCFAPGQESTAGVEWRMCWKLFKLPTFLLAARLAALRSLYCLAATCYNVFFPCQRIKQKNSLSIMYTCRDAGRSMIAFRQSACEKYARPFEAATLIPMSGYAIESPLQILSTRPIANWFRVLEWLHMYI